MDTPVSTTDLPIYTALVAELGDPHRPVEVEEKAGE